VIGLLFDIARRCCGLTAKAWRRSKNRQRAKAGPKRPAARGPQAVEQAAPTEGGDSRRRREETEGEPAMPRTCLDPNVVLCNTYCIGKLGPLGARTARSQRAATGPARAAKPHAGMQCNISIYHIGVCFRSARTARAQRAACDEAARRHILSAFRLRHLPASGPPGGGGPGGEPARRQGTRNKNNQNHA
jgi:hypothetical protein